MINPTTSGIFQEIVATLDIPDSAYEKAESRYKALGAWFDRPEAHCSKFRPHIYPQGSFRLGTVVRPLNENDSYDLDLGCRLRQGVTKQTHAQAALKSLVGLDLEEYRRARGIENGLEEKHRCWRMYYQDDLNFHMDTVPSIPEELRQTQWLTENMVKAGTSNRLAAEVASFAGAITDKRLANYRTIDANWRISNSEGYARWFESRINLALALLEERTMRAKAARVDNLPARKWKSPLQQAVQILKRHRDVMFAENPDGKPVSIIITTLAGQAYRGQVDTSEALSQILSSMGSLIRETTPRVPNPVNPVEDFADKWGDSEYRHLHLEQNFRHWLEQANADLQAIGASRQSKWITEQVQSKLASTLNADALNAKLKGGQGGGLLKEAAVAGGLSFPPKPLMPSKPAGFA